MSEKEEKKEAANGTSFDVFLSHDWGKDVEGRDNHARVLRLCQEMTARNIVPWCDEYEMKGNIDDCMASGIDNSRNVIIFVTKQYIKKANGLAEKGEMDSVYKEFNYTACHVHLKNIITVVMEEGVKDTKNEWKGKFGLLLSGQLYIDYSNAYNLKSCLKQITDRIHQNQEITYPDGSIYRGPINDKSQRHGHGVLIDSLGNVHEGLFNEDKMHALKASIIYKKSGAKIEGHFEDGNFMSESGGTLRLPDGTVMEGKFVIASAKKGFFDGHDIIVTFAGSESKYTGDIKDNQLYGYGIMEYQNGDVYKGAWKYGEKHGFGKIIYRDGDVSAGYYAGFWKNDIRHGRGELELPNLEKYKGYFENDMMQGRGKYELVDGSTYEGRFVKNKRCGIGKFTHGADKRIFYGNWKNNKMDGKGYRHYSNGDKYFGYFKRGKRQGHGEMLFASGALFCGQWGEGKMLEGIFDFEQEEIYRNRRGWKNSGKSTLFFFRPKNKHRDEDEWVPKERLQKGKNPFSCRSTTTILGAELFNKKCQDFMTGTSKKKISRKNSKYSTPVKTKQHLMPTTPETAVLLSYSEDN